MDCKIRLGVFVFFVLFKNSDRLFVEQFALLGI